MCAPRKAFPRPLFDTPPFEKLETYRWASCRWFPQIHRAIFLFHFCFPTKRCSSGRRQPIKELNYLHLQPIAHGYIRAASQKAPALSLHKRRHGSHNICYRLLELSIVLKRNIPPPLVQPPQSTKTELYGVTGSRTYRAFETIIVIAERLASDAATQPLILYIYIDDYIDITSSYLPGLYNTHFHIRREILQKLPPHHSLHEQSHRKFLPYLNGHFATSILQNS